MRSSHFLTKIVIGIFCLGMILPFVNDSVAIPEVEEENILKDLGEDAPNNNLMNPLVLNAPTTYEPYDDTYLRTDRPLFDWKSPDGIITKQKIEIRKYVDGNWVDYIVKELPSDRTYYRPEFDMSQGYYNWRAQCKGLLFWGDWSSRKYFTIDYEAPSSVTVYNPENGESFKRNDVYFSWKPATDNIGCNTYFVTVRQQYGEGYIVYQEIMTTAFFLDDLVDGMYVFTIRAIDYAGNSGPNIYTTFFVDTVPPEQPELLSPDDDEIFSDTTVHFEWKDDDDVYLYRLRILNLKTQIYVVNQYISDNVTVTNFPDGQYRWHVQAYDLAGNSKSSSQRDFIIDAIMYPPILLNPSNGLITNETDVVLSWSMFFEAVDQFQLQVDIDSDFSTPFINENTSASNWLVEDLIDGEYYWRVRAQNPAGVWSNYATHRTFIVDTISPEITFFERDIESPDDNDYVLFHCKASDENGINLAQLVYRMDGGEWVFETMTHYGDDIYYYISPIVPYDTFYEYYFIVYDNSNPVHFDIEDNDGSYFNFTVISHDLAGPTIEGITHDPISPTELDLITISANISDPAGISYASLYYKINDENWQVVNMSLDSGITYTVSLGFLLPSDVVLYSIKAADNSAIYNSIIDDNSGIGYSFIVISSDVTGPSITNIITDPLNPHDSDLFSLKCDVIDINGIQGVTLHYRIDGGDWINISMSLLIGDTYEAILGIFDFGQIIEYYITAIDNHMLHNQATENNGGSNYNFTIICGDYIAPEIISIDLAPVIFETNQTIINCTAFDMHDIQYLTLFYRINGASWIAVNMTTTVYGNYTINLGLFNENDIIEYYFYIVDNSQHHNIAIIDNEGAYYSIVIADGIAPNISSINNYPVIPNDHRLVYITCIVEDPSLIHEVILYYRLDGGFWYCLPFNELEGNLFQVALGPITAYVFVEYYIVAIDDSMYQNQIEDDNGGTYYSFSIIDKTGPSIGNNEVSPSFWIGDDDILTISCNATDISGVENVTLYYRINNLNFSQGNMSQISDYDWEIRLGPFEYGTFVEYYFTAIDSSVNHNLGIYLTYWGYFNLTIRSGDRTGPVISSVTFVHAPTTEPIYTITCSVFDASGIDKVSIFYLINDQTYWEKTEANMSLILGTTYAVTIGTFEIMDTVYFYIKASDNSPNNNKAYDYGPSHYYMINVRDYTPPPPQTTNEFSVYYILPIVAIFSIAIILRKRKRNLENKTLKVN
ncbi:MAG: Ig-like domain-containing protein [Candidatus Heimdallarchaeota archaeon]